MGIINIIKNLIKKGTQTLACDDSGDYQTAQVSFLGQTHTVRQIVQYGLYGHSPTGSQWVIVNLRANSNDKMGIANDYTNRPKNLKEGEVVLYNTKTQTFIKLDKDGNITLSCTDLTGTITDEITLDFTTADLTGDVNIIGDLDVTGVTKLHGGNITLTGGAVAIGPATTIDGKVFLNHTHSAGSYLDSVAGAVTGSSGGVN